MLQQERFSKLRFPVHKIKATTADEIFKVIPGLRRYFEKVDTLVTKDVDEVTKHLELSDKAKEDLETHYDENKRKGDFVGYVVPIPSQTYAPSIRDVCNLIRYVVFLYDPDSDLTDEFPDEVTMRKDAAAREAGWRLNANGKWPAFVADVMEFKNKTAVDLILDYLKTRKNPVWMQLKFVEEDIDTLYRKRADGLLRGEVNDSWMKQIKDRTDEKERLLKQFYSYHNDLRKVTEEELLPISPENVFKELKVPEEVWKLTQVTDVPLQAESQQAHN